MTIHSISDLFHRYVVGATLPDQFQEFEGTATVSGWGTLSYDEPSYPDTLQSVDVPIVLDEGNAYSMGYYQFSKLHPA